MGVLIQRPAGGLPCQSAILEAGLCPRIPEVTFRLGYLGICDQSSEDDIHNSGHINSCPGELQLRLVLDQGSEDVKLRSFLRLAISTL